jgi:hypothetical protein
VELRLVEEKILLTLRNGTALLSPADRKKWDYLGGQVVQQVTCGDKHTLIVTRNGEVYAWGSNENGRCALAARETAKPGGSGAAAAAARRNQHLWMSPQRVKALPVDPSVRLLPLSGSQRTVLLRKPVAVAAAEAAAAATAAAATAAATDATTA